MKKSHFFFTHTHLDFEYLMNVNVNVFMNNLNILTSKQPIYTSFNMLQTPLSLELFFLMRIIPSSYDGWMLNGHMILIIEDSPLRCFSNLDTTHCSKPINFNI